MCTKINKSGETSKENIRVFNIKKIPDNNIEIEYPDTPYASERKLRVTYRRYAKSLDTEDLKFNLMHKYLVDIDDDFVKVFLRKLNQLTPKIGHTTAHVFLWILGRPKNNRAYFWLNVPKIMRELDIKSEKTLKKSLKDLYDLDVIRPINSKDKRYKNFYWFNIFLFYRGDRVTLLEKENLDIIHLKRVK